MDFETWYISTISPNDHHEISFTQECDWERSESADFLSFCKCGLVCSFMHLWVTSAPTQGSWRPSPVWGMLRHVPGIYCMKWDLINSETEGNCSHSSEWQGHSKLVLVTSHKLGLGLAFPWEVTRDTGATFFSERPPEACLASHRTEFTTQEGGALVGGSVGISARGHGERAYTVWLLRGWGQCLVIFVVWALPLFWYVHILISDIIVGRSCFCLDGFDHGHRAALSDVGILWSCFMFNSR